MVLLQKTHMCTEYNILQMILRSSQTSEACCGLFRTRYSKCDPAVSAPRSFLEMQTCRPQSRPAASESTLGLGSSSDVCVPGSLIHPALGICMHPPDEEPLLSLSPLSHPWFLAGQIRLTCPVLFPTIQHTCFHHSRVCSLCAFNQTHPLLPCMEYLVITSKYPLAPT